MSTRPDLDIRQSPGWLEYLSNIGWSIHPTSFGVHVAARKFLGGSLIKVQRFNNITAYQLTELESICAPLKPVLIKLEPAYEETAQLAESAGYIKSSFPLSAPSTIYIDLEKSEQNLWDALSKSAKYSVNRARREGARVEVIINPSEEQVLEVHELFKQSAKRKRFFPQDFKDTFLKLKLFAGNTFITKVYTHDNQLFSAYFILGFNDMAFYAVGGMRPLSHNTKAGYLLMWETILFLKKQGFKLFDLEGTDDDRFPNYTKNWAGFGYFKEKFGGITMRFPYPYVKVYNRVLRKALQFSGMSI